MVWSKVKSVLRTLAARTFEALEEAIVVALRSITPDDAANCIRHAGVNEVSEPQAARSVRIATSGGTPRRIGGPVVPRPGCT